MKRLSFKFQISLCRYAELGLTSSVTTFPSTWHTCTCLLSATLVTSSALAKPATLVTSSALAKPATLVTSSALAKPVTLVTSSALAYCLLHLLSLLHPFFLLYMYGP